MAQYRWGCMAGSITDGSIHYNDYWPPGGFGPPAAALKGAYQTVPREHSRKPSATQPEGGFASPCLTRRELVAAPLIAAAFSAGAQPSPRFIKGICSIIFPK